ncbi:MAG: ribonuclease HI [Anaerolineaceae bacterium]|nr:ribonuclease HI [Anaerolineaceae bacterium]
MTKPQVTIYTDGGAKPNPGGPGGWAALLIHYPKSGHKGKQERELSGAEPSTTNNRMELTAAIMALEALREPCEVTLCTDSQYLKNGITEWLPGWIRRGWKTSARKAVKNQDLWQRLHAACRRHEIHWRWVRGHAGDPTNRHVDRLASAARESLT